MHSHPEGKAYFALVCVCIFWGTTYLGIRMALEMFPPAMLVVVRFILSGAVLTAFALVRGTTLPKGKELIRMSLLGFLILGIGNGSLSWSEMLIPSGLASLFVTLSPFWMVGLEALMPGGTKLHLPSILGMVIGFAGTALLVVPDPKAVTSGAHLLIGFLICQLGVFAWCLGSILQKHMRFKTNPIVTGGLQQLAAGIGFVPIAIALPQHHLAWSTRGVGAVIYLAIFGSIVGYSAYIYALDKLPVSLFSVYTYVNAVVAVLLGWLVYSEPLGWREVIAMVTIFAGVGIVKWQASSNAHRIGQTAGTVPADV